MHLQVSGELLYCFSSLYYVQPHIRALNPAACFENYLLSSDLVHFCKGTGTDKVPQML